MNSIVEIGVNCKICENGNKLFILLIYNIDNKDKLIIGVIVLFVRLYFVLVLFLIIFLFLVWMLRLMR